MRLFASARASMVDEAAAGAAGWPRLSGERPAEREELTLEGIERVYLEQAHRFARAAAAVTGDRAAAEDAVQDAFARAIAHRRKFSGSGSLEAWLWRIVVNMALNRQRKRRSDDRAADAFGRSIPSVSGEPSVDDAARKELLRLPRRQRAAVFLRYYADLDYREIAEVLSVTPGGVAKLLHDAHATLARTLEGRR